MTTHLIKSPADQLQISYSSVFRSYWWLILGTVIVALAGAGLYLTYAQETYSAQTSLLVTPASSTGAPIGLGLIPQSSTPESDIQTAIAVMKTPEVAEKVRSDLRLNTNTTQLLDKIVVQQVASSNIVNISATDPSPQLAARLADSFGRAIVAERTAHLHKTLDKLIPALEEQVDSLSPTTQRTIQNSLLSQIAQLRVLRAGSDPTIRVENEALLPTTASNPKPKLTIIVAVIVGLLLGSLAALGLSFKDRRLRRPQQLSAKFSIPILTRVSTKDEGLIWVPAPVLFASHNRHSLDSPGISDLYPNEKIGQSLFVVGPPPFDTVTSTAYGLAITLATHSKRVILIDSNYAGNSHTKLSNYSTPRGLESVIDGRSELPESLVHSNGLAGKDVQLLLSEGRSKRQDLSWSQLAPVIAKAKTLADYVIVNAPLSPKGLNNLTLSDSPINIVIAVRINKTKLPELQHLIEVLELNDIEPRGFVIQENSKMAIDNRSSHVIVQQPDKAAELMD